MSDDLLEENAVGGEAPVDTPGGDGGRGGKPRRPWLAIVATLVSPLLGYLYVGAPLRGILVVTAARATMWIALFLSLGAAGPATFLPWIALLLATATAVLADVWQVASTRGRHYVLRRYNRWYAYLGAGIVLLVLDSAFNSAVRSTVHAFKVPSASMRPTLEPGDHLLVDKTAYWNEGPKRFDVVVFSKGNRVFIKRVIGLPGETVEIRERRVFIDGKPLSEPHAGPREETVVTAAPDDHRHTMAAMVVPHGEYFVLGDARDHSHDSRFTGPVAREDIEGRVKILYFSWSDSSPHIRWDRVGMPVR